MPKKTAYPYPYTCDYCKHAPKNGRFPRRWRWKTEKGFREHRCYRDEAANTARLAAERDAAVAERQALWREWLALELYAPKLGEEVIAVMRTTTGPTHEWRGSRMVRIRYNPEYQYFVMRGTITAVIPFDNIAIGDMRQAIADRTPLPCMALVNGSQHFGIFASATEAQAAADEENRNHREWLKEVELCQ